MSLSLPFALIGSTALFLLFIWLISCVVASVLSDKAGYGEKPGLATGLLLSAVAIPIWLIVYAVSPRRRQGAA